MALDVVDGYQRQAARVGKRLGVAHGGEQRAHQPRPAGDGHGVDVFKRHAGFGKRRVQKRIERLHVHARGDFRHHAAEHGVAVDLREYLIGQRLPTVAHDGHGGLVAAGLKGQDGGVPRLLQRFHALIHTNRLPKRTPKMASGTANI